MAKISQRKEARTIGDKKTIVTIPYAVFNIEEFQRKSQSSRVKNKVGYETAVTSFNKYFIRLQNEFVVFGEIYLKTIIDNIDDIKKVKESVRKISLELSGEI